MRNFLSLFLIMSTWVNAFAQGDPAPYVKGQASSGLGNQASTIFVPQKQSTKINAYQALIETGNTNMLANPDFEGATSSGVPIGWTCATGTCTKTTTSGEFSSGIAAMKIVPASNVFKVSQSVSTPSGIIKQGYASIRYKIPSTCSATTTIAALVDSLPQTTVTNSRLIFDDTWREFQIPLTFGSSSVGIQAEAQSSCTGNIFIDFVEIKTGLPLNTIDSSSFFGTATTPTTASCAWSITGTTFTNYSADSDCPVPTVTGGVQAPATKIPGIIIPAGSKPGYYTVIAKGSLYAAATTDSLCNYRLSDGTIYGSSQSAGTNGSFSAPAGQNVHTFDYSAGVPTAKTIQIQAREMTGSANSCNVNADSNGQALAFEVHYTPPYSATAYTQASSNYSRRAFTATSPNSSVTFSSQSCYHSRDGEYLIVDCYVVSSASTGSEARIALPDGLTSSANIGTTIPVGQVNRTGFSSTFFANTVMVEASKQYIVFGRQDSTVGSITKTTGSSAFGTEAVNFNARVPIAGWESTPFIVGSFEGYVKTNGTTRPNIFSASITTTSGAVSNNKGGIITSCTSTGSNNTVCTTSGLFGVPNCSLGLNSGAGSVALFSISSKTSSGFTLTSVDSRTAAALNTQTTDIICHGE